MSLLGRLLAFGPHAGAHRVAFRAGVSVFVPLLVLWLTGHLAWSVYAAFGAFTSLYGRERVDRARIRLQATAGTFLVVAVCIGVAVGVSPHRAWLAVPVTAAVAGVASYLSFTQGWHPPGAMFAVFGVAAVAAQPHQWGDLGRALLVSVCAAVFALLVGNVGALYRRARRHAIDPPAAPIGASIGVWHYTFQSVAGALVAGSIATSIGIGRPYWAMVGAVVPLAARELSVQVVRGVHRVVGTLIGLLVAAVVLGLELHGLALVVVITLLQTLTELVVGRHYGLALIFITPLALAMNDLVRTTPTHTLLAERGLETVIGVAVALALAYVTRRDNLAR